MNFGLSAVEVVSVGVLVSCLGGFGAYLYGKDTAEFRWSEYIFLLSAPTIVIIWHSYVFNWKIIILYTLSAVAGFCLEYLIGFAYHKTLNRRLWTYDPAAYGVHGYTSWLTLPMWGVGGVFFWSLGSVIGI